MTGSETPRSAVFRCDAGAHIGGGHVVRCLALADAMARQNWRCTFAVRDGTRQTMPLLERSGHLIADIEATPEAEPQWLSAHVGPCDLLVVDHYERGRNFEAGCRDWVGQILVLDDSNDRDHDCDFLVSPSPLLDAKDFTTRVPEGTRILTGPAYAPLRAAFANRRFATPSQAKNPQRLLIGYGAADPDNATGRTLDALEAAGLLDEVETDVILGSNAPHLNTVTQQGARMDRVQLHIDPPDAVTLMAGASVTVGAAGTSAWERCALGGAAIMVSIADNQRPGARFLANAGAAIDLGSLDQVAAADLAETVSSLLSNPSRLASMKGSAATLCDGLGAERIAAMIDPPVASDNGKIYLKPATLDDEDLLFSWQTQPDTRQFSRNPAPPTREDHHAWMANTLRSPSRILSLVLHRGTAAGLVRLDRIGDSNGQSNEFEVSILIAPEKQRLGLGQAALDLAHRLRPASTLRAEIHPDNASSQALFRRAGYIADGRWHRKSPLTPETDRTQP